MKIRGEWLFRPSTQAVFEVIEGGGHLCLAVGGCVRDDLLGRVVNDIDLTTDATPQQVTALADSQRLKVVPTGVDHGTVTILSDGVPYEVTTLRRDLKTDGRHATVGFGASVEDDANRRDFTINAMYADRFGDIRDPIGGMPDLRARRVRFVGDAEVRVAEDHLRILRFFRFTALIGDPDLGMDADGLAACTSGADGLEQISRERIGAEMKKLLAADDPAPAVAAMQTSGVLWRVLPGADTDGLAVLVHHEQALGTQPDALRRLAVLGGVEPESALRLSRAEARQLVLLRDTVGTTMGAAEIAWRFGQASARDVALLRAALLGTRIPDDLSDQIGLGSTAQFPVSAADLLPQFQGPALGAELARLERLWITSGFAADRATLLA